MLRRALLVVVVLVGLSLGIRAVALAQMQDILVAGQDKIAIIDADDNGIFDDDADCAVHARTDGSSLDLFGRQSPTATNRMLLCADPHHSLNNEGHCFGSGFVSADFAEAVLDSCQFSSGPFVPMFADFCSSLGSCLSPAQSPSVAAQAATGPLQITAGAVFQTLFNPVVRSGFGRVCGAGGPTAQITGDDGVTVLRELVLYPNSMNPTHMCAHNVPVQLFGGGKVLRTACFPVRNGAADFALDGAPDTPFVVIDFNTLPSCSAAAGAPTMTVWGLIALMVTLLALGTWGLGRRRGFYDSLPLP